MTDAEAQLAKKVDELEQVKNQLAAQIARLGDRVAVLMDKVLQGEAKVTTATDNPWEPKIAELEGCAPLYRDLLKTLHAAARADEALTTAAAIVAAVDLAGDLTVSSGLLWESPDIVAALRALADTLEARRNNEAARTVHATLRAVFSAARPPTAN